MLSNNWLLESRKVNWIKWKISISVENLQCNLIHSTFTPANQMNTLRCHNADIWFLFFNLWKWRFVRMKYTFCLDFWDILMFQCSDYSTFNPVYLKGALNIWQVSLKILFISFSNLIEYGDIFLYAEYYFSD